MLSPNAVLVTMVLYKISVHQPGEFHHYIATKTEIENRGVQRKGLHQNRVNPSFKTLDALLDIKEGKGTPTQNKHCLHTHSHTAWDNTKNNMNLFIHNPPALWYNTIEPILYSFTSWKYCPSLYRQTFRSFRCCRVEHFREELETGLPSRNVTHDIPDER